MLLSSTNGRPVISSLGFHRWHGFGLAGSSDVQALQQALVNLATATGRPQINPGKVDGVVGTQTVMAVIAATDLLAEQLPSTAFLALKAATAGAVASKTVTAEAVKGVEFLAVPLTVAANTAAVKFKQNPASVPAMPVATPWYKTPWGVGGIIVAALVGYKLFLAPKAS